MKKNNLLFFSIAGAMLSILPLNESLAAANFTINPNGTLPTTVITGSTVSALYTVTNQTSSTRSGYVIRGLPATVTQDSSSGYCANPLTLAAHASCILKLNISGEAKSSFALCRGASCTSASTALNVSVKAITMPLVAGGTYRAGVRNFAQLAALPLILANTESGWAYTLTASNLPAGMVSASITGVSCNSSACFAIGVMSDTGQNFYPLVAKGSKYGSNWVFQTLSLPQTAVLTSVNCKETFCLIGGTSDPNTPQSIIYSTHDNGQNWTQESITGPQTVGSIYNIYCDSSKCIATAARTATFPPQELPYLLTGDSNGSNWHRSYAGMFTGNAVFTNAACNTNACVVVGYGDNGTSINSPIILVGDNMGENWSLNNTGTVPQNTGAQLNSVACNPNACVAVGTYQNADQLPQSLIAASDVNAATWTYSTFTPPEIISSGLNSVSCGNSTCVAAGNLSNIEGKMSIPLIITGSLNGTNWKSTYSTGITNPRGFNVVVCTQSSCFAVGSSSPTLDSSITAPLASLSTDNGASWINVVSNTSPTLPAGYGLGQLFTASINDTVSAASTRRGNVVGP